MAKHYKYMLENLSNEIDNIYTLRFVN